MTAIGIDIGTTSICAVAVDPESGELQKSITLANPGVTQTTGIQDPEKIVSLCTELADRIIDEFGRVLCIGITGQMHGIIYLDKNGNAVSPLYTWQFSGANELCGNGQTYTQKLSELTGFRMSAGFGLSTLFLHTEKSCVPEGAVSCCTVHDYFAMKLCSRTSPIMHTSDAASFGLFSTDTMSFDRDAVRKAGLSENILPDVSTGLEVIGEHRGIPVCIAIGDNQASFIGSVCDMKSCVLVNIGTGSQVSFATSDKNFIAGTELRPCCGSVMLRVGSALCGGMAFSALERFLRSCAELVTGQKIPSAYPSIDRYLEKPEPENPLEVSTLFEGTRDNPSLRGSVCGIGLDNFTPGHLIWGTLHSIADELYDMYTAAGEKKSILVGSGNGLRKNPALQSIFEQTFGMKLLTPQHKEEAAFGAALCGLCACGRFDSIEKAQKLIRY